jgi:serine/threonine-protein kinase
MAQATAQRGGAKPGTPQTAAEALEHSATKAKPADALAAMAQAARGAAPGAPAAPAAAKPPAAKPAEAAPVADPLVGTTVNGFKVLSRIGSGGFGVVYRAFDTNLERSVAIKMLPPRIAKAGKGLLDRFLREARSAAKLSHPNIVTIHQICPYKDTFYIVMELVDGGALHEHLAQRRRFEPAEATRIIRAAAEGLGHAHRRGIIHRDIKPGNIMLTNDGQVKVSDFGLARDVLQGRDIVGPGHSLGTPRYMAPEQALGEEPTASSDLYSLAATYYALLTGRAPFDAPTERELMRMHVTEELPDPRQFVPTLPAAAFRFFEKAMAKQSDERFLTAEEFVEALDRLDFSQADASKPLTPQALSAQIGPIAPEDRGSHLTETLGRAVRRAQRERTPTPMQRLAASELAAARGGKSRVLLWVLIAVGAFVVIGGAILVAFILAWSKPPGTPGVPARGGPGLPGTSQPGAGPPETTPAGTPPSPPPAPPSPAPAAPGQQPAQPPAPPASPLEDAARQALDEAKKYERDSNIPRYEVIRVYQETVIDVYPKTKAADEARKAIEKIKAETGGGKPPEK